MALIAQERKVPLLGEGIYTAVCYAIVDLGMQYNTFSNVYNHKIMFLWEIPSEKFMFDGVEKSYTISKRYTCSLSRKSSLRPALEAWIGRSLTVEDRKAFELKNMLNKGCNMQIIHEESNDNVYANISSIMSLKKDEVLPELENECFVFDMDDQETFDNFFKLPEWVQEMIEKADNNQKIETILTQKEQRKIECTT